MFASKMPCVCEYDKLQDLIIFNDSAAFRVVLPTSVAVSGELSSRHTINIARSMRSSETALQSVVLQFRALQTMSLDQL